MRFRGGEQVMPSPMSFAVTRGFATGTPGVSAAIGGRTIVNVYDQRGTDQPAVERQETTDADGNTKIDFYIRQAVQDEVTRPSAKTNRALRGTYGFQQQVVRR